MPRLLPTLRVEEDMEAVANLERDAQLMLRVRDGDETSFALLLERHRAPVVHFLFRMVRNQAVSEELAQEVFFRVYKSRGSYEPTAKFTTWLFRIATHLALNSIRDGKKVQGHVSLDEDLPDGRAREVADRARTVEQSMVDEVRKREVQSAIEALPEKQRAAVLLHKYEGLGYAQISKVLECSESATKSLLFRAYETLRVRLVHLA
jgi:RNA polymerase sigma-70 factor (ECF subfamily)